jgi:hypothetical protein
MADSRVSIFLLSCSSMRKYAPLLAAKKQVMLSVSVSVSENESKSKSKSKSRPDWVQDLAGNRDEHRKDMSPVKLGFNYNFISLYEHKIRCKRPFVRIHQ